MRVKTEIWVKAYLRRRQREGTACYIATRGDENAGAVFVHVDNLAGSHWLYGPAPAGLAENSRERHWISCLKNQPVSAAEVEAYLRQQKKYDPDIWIIEIEDKKGRHFLDDLLVE